MNELYEELEEEFEESKWKKPLVITIAVFLLIIFLVYILANTIGLNVLAGLLESSKVNDNEIDFSFDGKLVFLGDNLDKLKEIYFTDQKVEIKVCLKGFIDDNIYYIDSLYIPEIYSQRFNQVVSEPCSDDSLVSLHSHPFKHCLPSEQDFISFENFKEKNENALMIVMCEEDRFNVYE